MLRLHYHTEWLYIYISTVEVVHLVARQLAATLNCSSVRS